MKHLLIIIIVIFISGCYATHSKPGAANKLYRIEGFNEGERRIDRIIFRLTYDSLDHRVYWDAKYLSDTLLKRTSLVDTIKTIIQNEFEQFSKFSNNGQGTFVVNDDNLSFDAIFEIKGLAHKPRKRYFEFHRSTNFTAHKKIDSIWVSPTYSQLNNTLIAEFKLLKMYRSGRGSAPTFSANIQLRFGYIGNKDVSVYRNFLIITTQSIGSGDYRRRGNENIDWWRPRHIDELLKRMQYELGLTDKKGRALPVQ